MKLTILDHFNEGDAVCVLCRTTLREYVESLPEDFKEYYVQRGIVSNRFLDNLWDTIEKKKHIPAIVLVADGQTPPRILGEKFVLGSDFKVLDGLQRSSRLKEAWEAVEFYNSLDDSDASITPVKFARIHSEQLRKRDINSSLFQRIVKARREGSVLTELFENNSLWVEIWFNLNDSSQIQKMLVLNAGHKAVNIKHQVELLFIGYLPILQDALGGAKIIREKEQSSLSYSKNREHGEFHFSHLISAFVSLNAGKPVTTNADFSASRSFDDVDDADTLLGTDQDLLISFSDLLQSLDRNLVTEDGVKWLGREVVLVGIFGAIGAYARETDIPLSAALKEMTRCVPLFAASLDLEAFEKVRNSLDLSKVNLGSVNKNAVYKATLDFLKNPSSEPIAWGLYFRGQA
ncbi:MULTISPECIES: hypothetical protein [unclassified Shinella]|uniref:hypothetical protein n=1 Tax=unclassified Shinella TaxID=2643062 RepID=UPI00234E9E58|nr:MULTISPECIES: hypothetical protein [unclassified Shinella]MCO5152834.1 hypothetical protein [Shinella sp.]MDC7260826.1 hypothetical protein [Shinella sp. HY16]MDC7267721.1 hypothetical protein [Shinella sp. YZ44]